MYHNINPTSITHACLAVFLFSWVSPFFTADCRATEDDLLPEDPDALTDESDDPDAKEVDYEDEYPESDEGEEDREDYGLYSGRYDEEGDFMGSADEFDHDDGY